MNRLTGLLLLLTAAMLWLYEVPTTAAAPRRASEAAVVLTLGLAEAQPLGPALRMPLRAQLTTATGDPVAGAVVAFVVDGRIDGRARTDGAGIALWRIRQQLRPGRYATEARFAGAPGLAAARAIFALAVEAPSLTLQPLPAAIGKPWELRVRLCRPSGEPVVGGRVALFLEGKRIATGRTTADGSATLLVRRRWGAGSYPVTATFAGVPGMLPAQASATVVVAPALLEIETVPPLPGVRFTLDGQLFASDAAGVARTEVARAGSYTLKVLPWIQPTSGVQATFARWGDELFVPQRTIKLPTSTRLQVGFDLSQQISADFLDLRGRAVDPALVNTLTVVSSDRTRYTWSGREPRWLPASRVVRFEHGLVARPISYVASSVLVDGSNVINQGQQRFDATAQRRWPIRLSLYSTRFVVRDAMFGFPIGSSLRLTYPDGRVQRWPLGPEGTLTVGLLARGGYSATVTAPGISSVIPIALSRDQEVQLLVISYLDLTVLGVILAAVSFGLLFLGRPQLLRLVRRPRPWALGLGPWGRRIGPWALGIGGLGRKIGDGELGIGDKHQPSGINHQASTIRHQPSRFIRDPAVLMAVLLLLVGGGATAAAARFAPEEPAPQAAPAGASDPLPLEAGEPWPAAAPTVALAMGTPAGAATPTVPQPPVAAATPQPMPLTQQFTITAPLTLGARGPEVVRLQQLLRGLGYFRYPENTGYFGAATEAAVRHFQSDRGLPSTGLVGSLTVAALNGCGAGCQAPDSATGGTP